MPPKNHGCYECKGSMASWSRPLAAHTLCRDRDSFTKQFAKPINRLLFLLNMPSVANLICQFPKEPTDDISSAYGLTTWFSGGYCHCRHQSSRKLSSVLPQRAQQSVKRHRTATTCGGFNSRLHARRIAISVMKTTSSCINRC